MDEIRRKLVDHHAQRIEELKRDLAKQRDFLAREQTRLSEAQELQNRRGSLTSESLSIGFHSRSRSSQELAEAVRTIKNSVERVQQRASSLESLISQSESTFRFLKTVGVLDENVDPDAEECPICYGDSGAPRAILRVCGHTACSECLVAAVTHQRRCPTCRAPATDVPPERNFWVVAREKNATAEDPKPACGEETDEKTLAAKVGSKIARLITLLKRLRRESTPENPNRAIVFSQFDSMLHRIGDLLNEHGVRSVYAKGNVYAKTSSIRKFKTDPEIAALLLSVDHSASGTNLQEATHVIFVDALLGDVASARATMLQAVGRAHRIGQKRLVRVYHLIAEQTVESDLHAQIFPSLQN